MYAFVDRPVESLCNSGRFLLWAMRGWMHSFEKGACPPRSLGRGFAGVGAHSALPDFHIAMALTFRDALESVGMGAMNHPVMFEDEALFLSMWRDISRGDVGNARKTLAFLVEEATVQPISRAMTATVAKLMAAGFDLSELSTQIAEEAKPSDE